MRFVSALSFGLAFMGSLSAYADCQSSIHKMTSLLEVLLKKNPSDPKQQIQGQDLQDKAISYITEFYKIDKGDSCRIQYWQTFVALSAAASPFDMESQGAQAVAKVLQEDSSLQTPYEEVLATFQRFQTSDPINSCRAGQLKSVVEELRCDAKKPDNPACIGKFHYERCAGLPDPSAE